MPVPSSEWATIRQILRERALPDLRQWIDHAHTGSDAWALSGHSLSWKLTSQALHVSHDEQPYPPVKLP